MSTDRPEILDALDGLSSPAAFSLLNSWQPTIDWPGLPGGSLELADGGRLRFEKLRRSVAINNPDGSLTILDLGRRDRMRSLASILTSDLVRVDGPAFEVSLLPAWSQTSGDVAVRDPLDRKGKRASTSVPVGTYRVSRYVDATGRPQLLAVGELEQVSDFGTFLMGDGTSYAHVRTTSGLVGAYEAGRSNFMRTVTDELVEQARAEGFARVVTKAGPIGVLLDCGDPGDYLALASYDAVTHGTTGIVVDLRRPPVRDGGIVDPA